MKGKALTYKVYQSGRYQGIFRAAEIEKLCGLPKSRVNKYAREHMKYAGKWNFTIHGNAMTGKEIKRLCS